MPGAHTCTAVLEPPPHLEDGSCDSPAGISGAEGQQRVGGQQLMQHPQHVRSQRSPRVAGPEQLRNQVQEGQQLGVVPVPRACLLVEGAEAGQ